MRALILVTAGSFAMAGIATAQATLFDLSFMAGCWQGNADTSGTLVIEERYTPPSGNVMLGTTRYLKQGKAVQFEFTLLRDSDGVELLPYPGGHPSDDAFRLTQVSTTAEGATRAIFEAAEHDFPKRIIYTGNGEFLQAQVDGGIGTNGQSWRMTPATCGVVR